METVDLAAHDPAWTVVFESAETTVVFPASMAWKERPRDRRWEIKMVRPDCRPERPGCGRSWRATFTDPPIQGDVRETESLYSAMIPIGIHPWCLGCAAQRTRQVRDFESLGIFALRLRNHDWTV